MPDVVQAKSAQQARRGGDQLDARIEESLQKLKPEQAEQIRKLLSGGPEDNPDLQTQIAEFRKLISQKEVSGAALDKLFAAMTEKPVDTLQRSIRPLREKNFAKLEADEQCAVLDIAIKHSLAAEPIAELLKLETASGAPRLTTERDSRGNTLLANLASFASATPHPDIKPTLSSNIDNARMVAELIKEITNPVRHVDQGSKGACAAASIQDILCRRQPAEYVRLVTGLLVDKTVEMRGGSLTAVEGSYAKTIGADSEKSDFRSLPERLFQSAVLHQGQNIGSYSYEGDTVKVGFFDLGGGMTPDQSNKMLNKLFGRERYELVQGGGAKIHERLKENGQPALVSMKWQKDHHALVYVRSDDQFVYLKDPNGEEAGMAASPADLKPSRELSPGDGRSNIRMPISEFEANLKAASIERKGPPPPDLLVETAGTVIAVTNYAQAEAKKLALALPTVALSVREDLKQEAKKVEAEVKAAIPVAQQKLENAVDDAVRFGSMFLPPPPPNPVQLFNQVFGPKK